MVRLYGSGMTLH